MEHIPMIPGAGCCPMPDGWLDQPVPPLQPVAAMPKPAANNNQPSPEVAPELRTVR